MMEQQKCREELIREDCTKGMLSKIMPFVIALSSKINGLHLLHKVWLCSLLLMYLHVSILCLPSSTNNTSQIFSRYV